MCDLTTEELALVRRLVAACAPVLCEDEQLVVRGILKRLDDLTPTVLKPFIAAVA